MLSFRMNVINTNSQQTSQQTRQQTSQQTSQQTIRLGSTKRRICSALYFQGSKTCNTCGSKRK